MVEAAAAAAAVVTFMCRQNVCGECNVRIKKKQAYTFVYNIYICEYLCGDVMYVCVCAFNAKIVTIWKEYKLHVDLGS